MKKLFLGIYREAEYSPGRHLSNDARILRLVGQALERLGAKVYLASIEEARPLRRDAAIVFSMVQGPVGIAELEEWKREGVLIVNDPAASRRTYRDQLCPLLANDGVAFPRSVFIPTAAPRDTAEYRDLFTPGGGAWLKRADVHATCADDVVKLEGWEELEPALERFDRRGLQRAVLQEHRAGDEVKFYGVRGGRLFWPYYPRDYEGYPFDEHALRHMAEQAADELDIDVYGGDAIIGSDGKLSVIDVNDWPSFAPCRGAAAFAIARLILATEKRHRTTEAARVLETADSAAPGGAGGK